MTTAPTGSTAEGGEAPEEPRHVVVRNDEEQYSIWPADQPPPPGWHATGFEGDESACLDHIEQVWTDMRPLSVRLALREASGGPHDTIGTGDAAVPPTRHATVRLDLVEIDRDRAERLAEGVSDAPAVDGYPLEGTRVAARVQADAARAGSRRPGFGMYQLVRRDDGLVVGDVGFHAAPSGGSVEIGYGLAPVARGHGLCTEAVAALCAWALAQDDVSEVVAATDAGNPASDGVLVRAGFTLVEQNDSSNRYRIART